MHFCNEKHIPRTSSNKRVAFRWNEAECEFDKKRNSFCSIDIDETIGMAKEKFYTQVESLLKRRLIFPCVRKMNGKKKKLKMTSALSMCSCSMFISMFFYEAIWVLSFLSSSVLLKTSGKGGGVLLERKTNRLSWKANPDGWTDSWFATCADDCTSLSSSLSVLLFWSPERRNKRNSPSLAHMSVSAWAGQSNSKSKYWL